MKDSSPFVVTISRQLGCGGAYVGQQLARRLNIFYADREIIDEAAKRFSVLEEDLKSREEKKLSFWQSFIRSYAVTPDAYVPPRILPPSDRELFQAESDIILRIAGEREAVIIGRCSDYILRDHPNHVSVFLHADAAFRRARLEKLYGVSAEAAEKMIVQSDRERTLYHRAATGREWTDVRRYDISLSTGKTGVDRTVDLLLNYIRDLKR
ncbi:MAG: cytidylate kinase-like family protein [Deltaproteobacteria bacterium]